MPEVKSLSIIVYGRVQGVSFRDFIRQHALMLGLTGYVQNIPGDKAVLIYAEGKEKQLKQLIEYARVGPPAARVETLDVKWSDYTGNFESFDIKR